MEEKYKGPERRESVRLEQDIPAEYNFINEIKSVALSHKRSGTIRNISSKGVRLEINELDASLMEGLYSGLIKLGILINLPGEERPLKAIAKVAWLTKAFENSDTGSAKYILGLEFLDISAADTDAIVKYILNEYLGE